MKKEKSGTNQYFWAIMILSLVVGGILGFSISNATTTGHAMNLNACKTFTTKCMDNYDNMNEKQQEVCVQKIMGCMANDEFHNWFVENYAQEDKTQGNLVKEICKAIICVLKALGTDIHKY